MMVINSNRAADRAALARNTADSRQRAAAERLSTGRRINSAADDAAGLAISKSLVSRIWGMQQNLRNVADGISMAQTAQGALAQMTGNLQRIRELAVQASNGTYTHDDRLMLQAEAGELREQFMHSLLGTRFNGKALFREMTGQEKPLQGNSWGSTVFSIQAGPDADSVIEGEFALPFAPTFDLTLPESLAETLGTLDAALDGLGETAARYGAFERGLQSSLSLLKTNLINLSASRPGIGDADYASEAVALAKARIMSEASSAMLTQANISHKAVLTLLR